MTINRASAISVKRELLPVLSVQLKAVVFNVQAPHSFEKRKKAETNYLLCKALELASLCTISLQAGNIEILLQLSWLFHRRCALFMTKFYFWSRPLHADSFSPKAVRGKSSYPHDCSFLRSKALQTWNIFSSVTVIFFIDFQIIMAWTIKYWTLKKFCG